MLASAVLALFAAVPTAPSAAPHPLLERPALIGASVTDGFLLPLEVNAMVTLADTVRAASKEPIPLPFRRSSALFFFDPIGHGTRYTAEALAERPTVLFAIDFLFWFGYGWHAEDDRLNVLARGLEMLEPFECPIVVGDFPDMHDALNGVGIHGQPMIYPGQVPEKATIGKLNDKLRAWAAARPNVIVLPLGQFVEVVRDGRPIELHGNRWPPSSRERLMDKDLLHTTFEGSVAVTLLALDHLVAANKDLSDALIWDKDEIRRRVLDARAAEIEQRTRHH